MTGCNLVCNVDVPIIRTVSGAPGVTDVTCAIAFTKLPREDCI